METGIPPLQVQSIHTVHYYYEGPLSGSEVLIAFGKKIDIHGDSVFNFCINFSCCTNEFSLGNARAVDHS